MAGELVNFHETLSSLLVGIYIWKLFHEFCITCTLGIVEGPYFIRQISFVTSRRSSARRVGAWVGYVDTISEPKDSGDRQLSDKTIILILSVTSQSLPSISFPIH
jgi:hypothetical protein